MSLAQSKTLYAKEAFQNTERLLYFEPRVCGIILINLHILYIQLHWAKYERKSKTVLKY